MDEIFGLKVPLIICTLTTNFFFEIPPCAKHVIFISEFVNFGINPPLYDIRIFLKFLHVHGGISKIFFLDHLSLSFLGQKW